jgi:predicted AlkP superfamily pyrophosphatase or phosphodiesterase
MKTFALAVLFSATAAFAQQSESRHVVLISIDGLMPAYYTQPDELGVKIPNLRKLMRDGIYAEGVIGVLPTVTYPSHTTLVTGVTPREHGVLTNKIFDPTGASGDAWNWYADIIEVPTLISAAKSRRMTTVSMSWPVSIGSGADYNVPEYWRPGSTHEIDRKLMALASSPPDIFRAIENAIGRPFGNPSKITDDDRTDAVTFLIRTYRPEVTLVHLSSVDSAGHDHGPMTKEYADALERVDAMIGKLMGVIQPDRTMVAIVSDHGFLPVRTLLKPNAILRAAGYIDVNAKGKVTDWRAFFHADGGSSALYVKDPADVDRIRALLTGKPGVHAIIVGERSPLVLDAVEGYYFSDSVEGEWQAPATSKGQHGFSPARAAMQSSLILVGPFSRRGSVGVVPMTSIAPTLAQYLGLTLSPKAGAPIRLTQ